MLERWFAMSLRRLVPCACSALLLLVAGPAMAGTVPATGRTGVATALPEIPVPAERPCVVQLFSDVKFTNAAPKSFRYTPPTRCRGSWTRVLLVADWSVSAGRQFDRTASIWIGGVDMYFGTTQEPSAKLAPHWRVERDVTDYSSWLRKPHRGRTILVNVVNKTYTGVIAGSAKLLFYPGPAPDVPDRVVSLSSDPVGALESVGPGTPRAGRTLNLPRNMTAIYLDVFAQSQASDEFWEFCVPDRVAKRLDACGGSGFRQTMVYVDGKPAGVAPVYPWIYTGGVAPALWRPIPGVQTLDFRPFRVNLTPFAGLLDNGKPHTVSLGVTNARDHFALAANLLIYRDPHRAVVGGALTRDTIKAGSPQHDRIRHTGAAKTRVTTTSARDFTVAGYVRTAHGRIETRVRQRMDFSSIQDFTIAHGRSRQVTSQRTRVHVDTRVHGDGEALRFRRDFSYGLHFDYDDRTVHGGRHEVTVRGRQSYARRRSSLRAGKPVYSDDLYDTVTPHVRYHGEITGGPATVRPWSSAQHVHYSSSEGQCFDRRIRSKRHVLETVIDGTGCGGRNHYGWLPFAKSAATGPHGSEDALWRQ